MSFQGIQASAYALPGSFQVLGEGGKGRLTRVIDRICNDVNVIIAKHTVDDCRAVLSALLVGDRTGIDKTLRQRFNRVGAGHLLAISGLHVGIVATVALLVFTVLFSQSGYLLQHGGVRKAAAMVAIPAVLFYGLIAGLSPSTQRAVIMISIFLLTLTIGRQQDSLNTLALAALLILIIHPPALFSVSMQLSFSAVTAILFGVRQALPPNSSDITSLPQKGLRMVFNYFGVSLLAILGTLPLVAYYFNHLSLVGFFANALLVPLIGFAVVPIGVFSVFVSLLSASAASTGLIVCAFLTNIALKLIDWFGALSWASVTTVTPSMLEVVCYYAILGAILWLIGQKTDESLGRGHHRKTAVCVLSIAVMVLLTDIGYWMHRRFLDDDLRITVLDVGQGSAALLELPRGHVVLIDGGGFSDNDAFDIGARIVAPFLWRNKIATVDTIVLSHPESDHLNGLIYIAGNFHVGRIWRNRDKAATKGFRTFMHAVRENGITMPLFDNLGRLVTVNGVRFEILHPPSNYHLQNERWRNKNNNSMVIRVSYNGTSILFPGDITAPAESELIRRAGNRLKSTILLAPHHGSQTSSTDAFISAVRPDTVIFSSGWRGRHPFPHLRVVQRYAEKSVNIVETKRNGAVRIRVDDTGFVIAPTLLPDE
jgi:competence protein ComEC